MKTIVQVSVIIVNYNTGKLLTSAVKSVIGFPGVEVVVIDNDSKDHSVAMLRKSVHAKNLIIKETGQNLGFGKGVNLAATLAKGKYLYLLNPDAALTKAALSRMLETAKKYGDRAIIAPRLENPDGSAQPSCFRPQTIVNAIKEYWFGVKGAYAKYLPRGRAPRPVHCAAAAAWLIPRPLWDKLGGLNEKFFLYFEDLDMCDRVKTAGFQVIYDPQAVVKHEHGVSSRTNPVVMKLFLASAYTYHGKLKKILIDLIIQTRNLFIPPVSTKKLFTLLVSWVGLVTAIAVVGYFLLPARLAPLEFLPAFYRKNFLLWSFANFDGGHYLLIAKNGYDTLLGQDQHAFFPLFPILIKLLSLTGLDLYTSAHLITLSAFVSFVFVFAVWAKTYVKNPLSALLLLLFSPGAIFLLAAYTEPLFLLFAVLTFLFADRGKWGKASLFAAAASATRVNGLFLALFIFFKLFSFSRAKACFYSLLSLSGFFAYAFYLKLTTNSYFTWYTAQAGWGKSTPTAFWITFSQYLPALTTGFVPDLTHLTIIIEVIVSTVLLYLLYLAYQKRFLDASYRIFLAAGLALPLITGSLGSMPRFSLSLFPLFLMIPSLPRPTKTIIYLLFPIICTIGIVLFTRGYWYA